MTSADEYREFAKALRSEAIKVVTDRNDVSNALFKALVPAAGTCDMLANVAEHMAEWAEKKK